jgi:hypothetical protein
VAVSNLAPCDSTEHELFSSFPASEVNSRMKDSTEYSLQVRMFLWPLVLISEFAYIMNNNERRHQILHPLNSQPRAEASKKANLPTAS